jgi:tRNA 2-selenouridine synthase
LYKEISIDQYFQSEKKVPLIDVRSPKEYNYAHIPGAVNIPLFDDDERKMVGITYKKDGREKAIVKGLELVGPKLIQFIKAAQRAVTSSAGSTTDGIALHCWRGGMRSRSMATLFDFTGLPTYVVKGGYKSYRRHAQNSFSKEWNLIILGGKTGSAKTKILQALKNQGEQIIDLEKAAHHKGSAFGHLGEKAQPTTEMFENILFEELKLVNPSKRLWVEDESHTVGSIFIPEPFWKQMRNAPVVYCDFSTDERIIYLVSEYGDFEKEKIVESVLKITKRLGGENVKAALDAYHAGDLHTATAIVLKYYDKTYNYGLSQRNPKNIFTIELDKINPQENAKQIIQCVDTIHKRNKVQDFSF